MIHICDNSVSRSLCVDILKHYKRVHLECHGAQQRLYSCMVILEMSGPVNSCSLNKLMQQLIAQNNDITNERPLTRMVVCGSPGLAVSALLASNLTWVDSDLQTSDVCTADRPLLKCEANESLAVLLTDSCPPEPTTTMQSTTQSSNLTTNNNVTTTAETLTPSVTNTTEQTHTTTENTTTVQQTNTSQGTAQPNMTTPITTINSTQSSTAQPVLQTSSQNMTVTVSDRTTTQNTTVSANTTLLTPTVDTELQNTTTAPPNTTEFTTISSVNSTLQMNSTAPIDSTLNTTTLSPNHTTEYNVTTVTSSTNHTTVNNVTTITSSTNHTTAYNVTTLPTSTNHTTVYNVTTIAPSTNDISPSTNRTTMQNVTAVTASTNHTTTYNVTTVTPSTNHTTTYNVTTVTPSTNHTTTYNVTTVTPSTNHTTTYNLTTVTPSTNHTTTYNVTTVTPSTNHTTTYNVTVTSSVNYTTEYNVTTARNNYATTTNNYTTVFNVNATDSIRNLHNSTITTSNATVATFTASPNDTTVNNATTVSYNYTNNVTTTTVSQNKTATDNVTTAPIRETQQNTTTPGENRTTATTARQVNVTLIATTSTKNTTADALTSVIASTTTPTVAPVNNQTRNHTTARVTNSITTTNKKDNFTTAATVVSTIVDVNQTAGISFNLSSTTSRPTTDSNLTTKGPGVNLTTTAATTTPETTTSATTTTPMHGTLPAQINTTTAEVSLTPSTTTLQTTTLTMTTTTNPGTGTPSTTIKATTTSQETQEEQANELLNQTQDASQLNSSQVAQLVGNLEKLLDGPTVSQAVGQKAVNVISNLMEGNSQALSASANRLIQLVDNLGLKLVVAGDREILSAGSLVLAVRNVDGANFPITNVDIFNTDNVQLRARSRSRSKRSDSALGSVFLPSSLTNGLSPEQQQQANRVQFTFYTKSALFQDASLKNETSVSPVLAASVSNLSISNLNENIQFTIRNINPIHGNFVASCAFWDFSQNGGGGGWSFDGCSLVNATAEKTTCSCNHLTSFAILLDLSREGIIDRQHAQILTFITYIGCGISAIFLAVTLLTYLAFPKLLRDIPAKILVQLCLSLLLLNLVFLLDGWLALYPAVGLCISTAFFLHYFLLTSFTWAGLEALHMYLSIVQVFTPYLSRYMLKFSLLGWGIPLLVVIVVIAVDKDNYGLVTYGRYSDGSSDDFCWLRNDIAFYVGVVAYFLLIFSLCLLVFIVVMVQLSRIKKQNPQNQPPNRGVMTDLRSIAGLIILLGLTWGFALFAWGPLYLPFVYLFSIFNSLQGFLVFIFHCAVKENVRRQWRTYLCCGKLRLAENSEWSRTATQNNRTSVATATTSAPYITSPRSSVASDGANSNDSVFADSGISDTSDTALNRRNPSL
ncbi:adhesion G-protein coupled receptor G2 [Centropristis striata]|uniref:adhesion G-protein coupled receptor G2 n=1 Tax=Centropristis striata TaxID=184440 RepID=UPI0027DFBD9B|nr:adhesion G-protein coupled receptor G2 [Centropristis striata]